MEHGGSTGNVAHLYSACLSGSEGFKFEALMLSALRRLYVHIPPVGQSSISESMLTGSSPVKSVAEETKDKRTHTAGKSRNISRVSLRAFVAVLEFPGASKWIWGGG
jgi:hypothetical protein